jgi:hypothetical protein
MAVNDNTVQRKSLMINKDSHSHIMKLADTFNVSQPEIVEAILQIVDNTRLQAKLAEFAAARKLTVAEADKKRQLLEGALKDMSAADVERLLSQFKGA